MTSKMSKDCYETIIAEDLQWLDMQKDSLENRHIKHLLLDSINMFYPDNENLVQRLNVLAIKWCSNEHRDWEEILRITESLDVLPKLPISVRQDCV